MLKKLGIGLVSVVAIAGAVVGVRTARFAPDGVGDARGITLATVPDVDVTAAANHLGEAIRFQTVSHQDRAENHAEEWTKRQGWFQTRYPAAHKAMVREVLPGGALIYEWKGSQPDLPPIILMAHQDVVPVTPGTEKDWKHPPFEGRISDGAVWGRGAIDDKGSLVGLFEAFEALAGAGFTPKRSVFIVSGHDEEVGGNGAKSIAGLFANQGIKALFTLDEGSAIVTDAPIVDGPAILIGVAEKGYATMKITAPAVGGHSSMPPRELGSVNLAKAVVAVHERQFPFEIRPPASQMLGALAAGRGGMTKVAVANQWLFGGKLRDKISASPAGAAMLHTTIAPTMLQGSPKENVLPQSANALVNFRIAPWQTSGDVMAGVKQAVGKLPVELAWVSPPREPTPISSATSQGWNFILAAERADGKDLPVAPYLVVGGTDSRSFSPVSQDVYRFMPLRLSTRDTAMIHGTNEHMTLENLARMISFYERLIATAAG